MKPDERKQEIRQPNIDLKSFIYKNYKDLIAVFLIVLFVLLLVFEDVESDIRAVLISLISTATGFIFGKKLD